MRPLTSKEMRKRGCEWCLDHKRHSLRKDSRGYNVLVHVCCHKICPYRELDKYETYDEYLKHSKNEGIDNLLGCVFYMQRDL